MLLGAGMFWRLTRQGQIQLGENLPVLQNSCLGWIISGEVGRECVSRPKRITCNLSVDVQDQLARFWQWEESGLGESSKKINSDDEECERLFLSTVSRGGDGRFVVGIPFKESVQRLGDSKQAALYRLYSLEKKFMKDERLRDEYCSYMREYEEVGHMTEVKDVESEGQVCFYLPHHGVVKDSSSTTKLRVVYDGSARSDSGVSINDLQYVGGKIQEDLISILLRFRQHNVAFCADIAKMYRQVWVKEGHRPFQRILWRHSQSEEVKQYNLNTVTFGLTSSPFLAVRCIKELALECAINNPEASCVISRDFYVDDMISGASTVQKAVQLCKDVSDILKTAGFSLRKFTSNRKEVLRSLDSGENECQVLNFGENEKTKTLGLYWNCHSDVLTYKVGAQSKVEVVTKRRILSDIAQIFDPLGLLSACVIIPKIILQKLWLLKLEWDDPLPDELAREWHKFKNETSILNMLCIPRHICCENPIKIEIHGFSDASQNAIGACVYVKSIDSDNRVQVKLLCAKSKVAPIKALTIPKLELSAALLLSKLIKEVMSSLTLKIDGVFLWCDSQVVLSWIKAPANQFQVFVSNRVSQIQTIVGSENWFYTRSEDNPADLVSRGISPSKLKDNMFWFEGPDWLKGSIYVPVQEVKLIELKELPDKRKNVTSLMVVEQARWSLFDRYSSLIKLKRVCACILRFINNCRCADGKTGGELSIEEIEKAERILVRISQSECFQEELISLRKGQSIKKGRLSSLTPWIDDEGILRVGGRIKLSECSFDKKHPMVLDAKHPWSKLIVRTEHQRLMHAGPQLLLGSLRERFWLIHGRNLVRKVVHDCVLCSRIKPKNFRIQMGNLPKSRLIPQPPFNTSGVDYMGPFHLKIAQGRGNRSYKAYVSLFICFTTRAIHLEVVTSLSTDSFIATFRRFVSRRGKPTIMYSDNGKNFMGAQSELKELGQFLSESHQQISKLVSNEGVKWSFIPAYSPHFGGLWEAGVKTVKFHLRRVIGKMILTYEDFSTVLCQIEAIVNSRPLTPLSSSPLDYDVLTPAHFLIGRKLTSLPDKSVIDVSENRLSRFQRLQQIQQQFWCQWLRDYIAELQQRVKWKYNQDKLKEGMLVVVREDNLPPLCWKMARVVQVHVGEDGIARVATLRTVDGTIKRSFAKLCPLPVETDTR